MATAYLPVRAFYSYIFIVKKIVVNFPGPKNAEKKWKRQEAFCENEKQNEALRSL